MYFSSLSINKTSWQLKQACDLINSVIRLTEMMSCMTMIALCCIRINESEAPQTGKKEEWDPDDVIGEMKWEDFGSGVNGRALINVCHISQESSRCWVHLFMILMTLIFPHVFSFISPRCSFLFSHCLKETIVPAQICWPDAGSLFYSLQKRKKERRRNRLLMEVEQSAWGTADSCQQQQQLQGVSGFFGYLHIYCPEMPQDLTV